MARYRIAEPCHLETHHGTHGHIEQDFEAGEVTPRSEQEEIALLHLTYLGLAEQVAEEERQEVAGAPE